MVIIKMTPQALDHLTTNQARKIVDLSEGHTVDEIVVQKGGLGLPEGYMSVQIKYTSGNPLIGGIDEHGVMST
jgi:hypothetical protein